MHTVRTSNKYGAEVSDAGRMLPSAVRPTHRIRRHRNGKIREKRSAGRHRTISWMGLLLSMVTLYPTAGGSLPRSEIP